MKKINCAWKGRQFVRRCLRREEARLMRDLIDPNPLYYEDTLRPPPQWWSNAVKAAFNEAKKVVDTRESTV
jgi:hypothetical protein